MLAVGLMSGTSLDGVDACLVEIRKHNKRKFVIKNFCYLPYEKEFKKRLYELSTNVNITIQKVCSMNVELSKRYVKAVKKLLEESHLKSEDIEFIAMHGQTVWHNPQEQDGFESSTLQLGDPSYLAVELNIKVISNFRMADMAAGGSGAPLVPFANYVLYASDKENIAMQNIGGISNVTFLKKGGKIDDIIAFDTGPGNMLIDLAMKRLYNRDFDDCGKIALSGKIIEPVLEELLQDSYLYLDVPKSTGREKYNESYLSEVILKIRSNGGSDADIITTLTAYTVDAICLEYEKFLPPIDLVIVSGGGVFNEYIMDRLRNKLAAKVESDYNADSLEALSFVILGYQTLNHLPSNVPSVTGAKKEVVLGSITNPIIRGNR